MNDTTELLDRTELASAILRGIEPKWLFFWGHTAANDGGTTKSCFSQWWAGHPFDVEGGIYPTAEHWMMAEKARLFGDTEALASILNAGSPALAKKLGRQVRDFDGDLWDQHRWDIVVRGNAAKFSQHADLRQFLVATGDRILVEASPYDNIWGIGLSASHPDAENPNAWKGLNLLGFALMEVRRQLKENLI